MTSEERDLDGVVALVAGATRGAGRGIAVELGAPGPPRALRRYAHQHWYHG